MADQDRIGLVVAGAGARGAYEAGALSVLLPQLEKQGVRPRVLVGTSAGSINVVLLAAKLHLGAERATQELLKLWRGLDKRQLTGSLKWSSLRAFAGYAGRVAYLPTGSGSLSSFGRFPDVYSEAIGDWRQIQANIDGAVIDAVAVTATSAASGGTVVFVQVGADAAIPGFDESKGIRYARAGLSVDHVVASCSVPVVFPARWVDHPREVRGFYWDGGVRLNTPIKPALAIGVDRVVVVSTGPAHFPAPTAPPAPAGPGHPDFDDAILNVVQATLDDDLVEDLHSLVRVNQLIVASGQNRLGDRCIYDYLFAGPDAHGTLGAAAAQVLSTDYRSPLVGLKDFSVLNRLLGRQNTQQAELQSYLLFDPAFIERMIELGQQAGEAASPHQWRTIDLPQPHPTLA